MKYRVYMQNTVNYSVEVEAEDADAAEEAALVEGLPGLMFVDHRYPDVGDWEAVEVIPAD